MSITCTILTPGRVDEYGRVLSVGQSYTGPDELVLSMQAAGVARIVSYPYARSEALLTHAEDHKSLGIPTDRYKGRAPIPLVGGDRLSLSDVTIVGGSPSVSVETDLKGRKRLKIVTGSGTTAQLSFPGLVNCYFGGDAYISLQGDYESGLQAINCYFAPGPTVATNYVLSGAINFVAAVANQYLQPGTGYEPFTWRTGKKNNSITGSITYPFIAGSHRIDIVPRAATVATVYLYAIGVGTKNEKGRCFVIVDDGLSSCFSRCAPLFNEVGIPVTASIIAALSGSSALYPGVDVLADFVSAGNIVVPHGPNQGSASGNLISNFATNEERVSDMNRSRDWIVENGLQTPNYDKVYVWPQGAYQSFAGDLSLLYLAAENGYEVGRCSSTINPIVQYNADAVTSNQRLCLPYSTHGWAGTTAGQVALTTALTDAITNAATYGTDIFVTFHDIVLDSTPDGSMDTNKCRVSDLLTIRTAMTDAKTAGTLEFPVLTDLVNTYRQGLFNR